jgi:putative transposase
MAGIACPHYMPTWSSLRNIEERCLTRTPSGGCKPFSGRSAATSRQMNGEAEHVHLLIHYPPKHSVSALVNSLKGVSSRLLRIERPDMEKRYWNNVLWSPSYFAASCGGAPLNIIKQYIEQEKTEL